MIRDEAQELVDAIDQFPVKQDAEAQVVSEVGDILYLALRFCLAMGIDPKEAVEMKLQRNSVKYPDHFSSNGWGYEKSRAMSKSLWDHMGGDHRFFEWLVDNT